MQDAVDKLKSMSEDSVFISQLEKEQIREYARELAIIDEINEKTIEIAKNLLQEKVDINIISKTTGLTIEEINGLK